MSQFSTLHSDWAWFTRPEIDENCSEELCFGKAIILSLVKNRALPLQIVFKLFHTGKFVLKWWKSKWITMKWLILENFCKVVVTSNLCESSETVFVRKARLSAFPAQQEMVEQQCSWRSSKVIRISCLWYCWFGTAAWSDICCSQMTTLNKTFPKLNVQLLGYFYIQMWS